ncbi:ROK family protein [Paenisporosarcina sp. OV554]|uniref:ROK family protein n=1 Tax=Paenisporosarcina sp. OV554 TaxID=2135694 RepID=UPI000D3642B9|nr:ROK family protein [Paenisporosarcina sp. OV554]PUB12912.1 glucokinase [Paenisporosarcina sp. OV554]
MKVLGVDIGGTKVRMGIVGSDGQVLEDLIVPTEVPLYPYLEMKILQILKDHPEVQAIGIGTRGMVDAEKGVITFETETLPGWQGTEVKTLLEKASGLRVEVNNDANCASLAESMLGAAKGFRRTLCLTLGTGLGGGFVEDGIIMNGTHGGACEVGHTILYPGGHVCSCGRPGCSEQYVSGTALRRIIAEQSIVDENNQLVSPNHLFQLALEGHTVAQAVTQKFTSDLAIVISSLQAVLDMDCVVIGGGVSDSADSWWDLLMNALEPLLLKPLEVKRAKFGNEAGMLGAALLVLSDEKEIVSKK